MGKDAFVESYAKKLFMFSYGASTEEELELITGYKLLPLWLKMSEKRMEFLNVAELLVLNEGIYCE